MIPLTEQIRKKLDAYASPYIDAELLQKILSKFAPNYTVSQLCDKGLIAPIKRGKWYMNNESREFSNPYIVGSLYMGDAIYAFGGLAVYNLYSLSTQVPEWYTIYNTKVSGQKKFGNVKLIFVRQRESFFYGIETKEHKGFSYRVMSRERAFIEALKEKKRFDFLPYGIRPDELKKLAKTHASITVNSMIAKICLSKT